METTLNITKYQDMNDFAALLLQYGYTIIANVKPSSYFHFFKDGAMGYIQDEYLGGGVSFSSDHKPCKHAGTGYSILQNVDRDQMTLISAEKACRRVIWPEHAHQGVKFWESPEEFINHDSYNRDHFKIIRP